MKARTCLPWALLPAVSLTVVACEETDDFSNDCLPVSLEGTWEGHDTPGTWWRFELMEQPMPPGLIQLRGTYVTDYLYHLDNVQHADTLSGDVQGGSQCLMLGARLADEVGLDFQLGYREATADCSFTGGLSPDGDIDLIRGGLTCTNDSLRNDVGLRLRRVRP
ncbi:MAG: hypothetical protein OXN92_12965 [Gammaproteobacteria bacterium]|nr:hypothetical protein [Gammaproteobacteria bacterium]